MAKLSDEERRAELRSIADDITMNLNPLFLKFCESAYNSGDLKRLSSLHGFMVRAIQANDNPKEPANGDND